MALMPIIMILIKIIRTSFLFIDLEMFLLVKINASGGLFFEMRKIGTTNSEFANVA